MGLKAKLANSLAKALPYTLFLYAVSVLTTMAGMEIFGWLNALLIGLLIWSDEGPRWPRRPFLEKSDWALLALMSAIVLSAIFQTRPEDDWFFIIGTSRFAVLFLLLRLGLERLSKEQLNLGLKRIGVLFALICVLCVVQHFTGWDPIRGHKGSISKVYFPDVPVELRHTAMWAYRVQGMWGHPVTFGHTMALSFAVVSGLALSGIATGLRQFALSALALLSGAALLFSYTRGAWIAAIASVCVMAFVRKPKLGLGVAVLLIGMIGAGTVLSPQFKSRVVSIASTTNQSNAERIDLWKANWAMFTEHPVLGVGYGINEDRVQEFYAKIGVVREFGGHAHNTFLQFLAGTGLVGFLSFAAFSVFIAIMSLRLARLRSEDQKFAMAIGLAALGSQVALHVGGLTECNFKDAEVNHQFMLITAVMTAVYRSRVLAKTEVRHV